MLYVFQVNTGTMLTLDMALTMESVQRLQDSIEDEYQIPVDKQVLLISGGQSLDPQMRVCSYSAGTDTNPIFLFSKGTIESASPPITSSISQGKEDNLKFQVEGLKNLPHSYSAVVSRTQLALQFHDLAKEKLKSCEALVLDQHLQQQGWMAVVANLEDITSAFEQRSRVFQQNMTEFLKERPDLVERLAQFSDILQILEKTPLLPCLMADGVMCMGEGEMNGEEGGLDSGMTLMKWISSQDQRSTLQQMAQQCSKALDQFSQQVLDTIATDMTTTMDSVNNPSMKEVKGLGDRLFGLEQLLVGAKKYLQEQAEMAQGMVQNQTRASNINDDSVLPDLCKSHQQQLTVMYKKHCQLTEISRRCQAAKEELCQNLHVRLRWIMYVEQQISGVHGKMVVYHENLKRLRKRLEIVRQVCAAPELYAAAVVEVYRRKIFGSKFHAWAGQVSELSISSHQDEVAKRKSFAINMERHFLNALFPGLGEFPPMFATQPPALFDTKLPDITMDDIQLLREQLPELATSLKIPPLEEFIISDQEPIDKNWTDIETQTQSLVMIAKEMGDTDIVVIEKDNYKDRKKEVISLETTSIELVQPSYNGLILPKEGQVHEYQETEDVETPTSLEAETPTRLDFGSSPCRPDALLMHSFEPKQLESFVSAPTTPDSITGLEVSARGETPFASLLTGGVTSPASVGGSSLVSGPDGHFYSAVTSPASERFAFASNPASYRSSPTLVEHPSMEEIDMLKQTLQEKELKVVQLEESSKIIQDELLDKEQALQKAQDEVQRTTGELVKAKGLIENLEKCVKCELPILRGKCTELQNSVGLEKDNFNDGLKTLKGNYERASEIVQSCLEEEKQMALKETVEKLQVEHTKEIDALNVKLEDVSRILQETKIELGQNQEALSLKAIEVGMIRESSAKEVSEIKNKMESEQEEAISALRMELAMELSDLETDNQEKTKQLEELKSSKETELKELEERLTTEKSEAISEIQEKWEEKHKQEMDDLERRLQETQLNELSEFQKTHQLKVDAACEDMRTTMEADKVAEVSALRTELENLQETLTQLRDEHEAEVAKQNEEHRIEVDNLKEDIATMKDEHKRAMTDQTLKVSQMEESFITDKQSSTLAAIEDERRQHKEEMQHLREELDRERNIAVADALGAANEVHAQEMEEVMKNSTDSTIGSLESRKAVETAEKQVSFNEAVNKVAAEKDKQIEALKAREAKLLEEQSRNKDSIEKLLTDKADLDSEMSGALHEAREAEKETKAALNEKEKEIQELRQRLDTVQRKQDSPAELPITTESDMKTLDPTSQDKLRVLLRAKEQECNTLKQQLVQLRSITTSHGGKSEKISIMDISSNDLVLIFFEEPRENYVVFSVEPTLYFVHSESLAALGLKQQHGSSGPKRQWIIGRVTDKEYCQAKKAQNRFKVAMGTKFYRVKAVRYDLKQEHGAKK